MKRYIKKISFYLIVIIAINFIFTKILSVKISDMEKKGIFDPPLRWLDFYSEKPNSIDIIFLGTSHAFRGFNPLVFDSILHINTFNLSSAAQVYETSFFVLENALEKQKPKIVVQGIYFLSFGDDDQLFNGGINFDYMQWSWAKLDFFFNGFSFYDQIALTFLPVLRHKGDLEYAFDKLKGKAKMPVTEKYLTKGFTRNLNRAPRSYFINGTKFNNWKFNRPNDDNSNLIYLKKISDLCKKNKIELIWVTVPIPFITYNKLNNTKYIHHFVDSLAIKWNVPYYDFFDSNKLNLIDTLHFFDLDHLNYTGANIFSKKLANIIKEKYSSRYTDKNK